MNLLYRIELHIHNSNSSGKVNNQKMEISCTLEFIKLLIDILRFHSVLRSVYDVAKKNCTIQDKQARRTSFKTVAIGKRD